MVYGGNQPGQPARKASPFRNRGTPTGGGAGGISSYTSLDIQNFPDFKLFGGYNKKKDTLMRSLRAIEDPEFYNIVHNGKTPERGILIEGPPGVGKSLLIRAGIKELSKSLEPPVEASQINPAPSAPGIYVGIYGPGQFTSNMGGGEALLKQAFEQAAQAPKAILVFEKMDTMCPNPNDPTRITMNSGALAETFIHCVQTYIAKKPTMVIIGETDRPTALNPDIKGVLSKHISISTPTREEREEIFNIHLKDTRKRELDLKSIARATSGFVGRDIYFVCQKLVERIDERTKLWLQKDEIVSRVRELKQEYEMQGKDYKESKEYKDEIEKIIKKAEVKQKDLESIIDNTTPSLLSRYHIEVPKIKWEDIAGLDYSKELLSSWIEGKTMYPDITEAAGLQVDDSSYIILAGMPGVGKTMLAKAAANEIEANFISISGPELFNKWFGESEHMIREIFKLARESKAAVLYLDELDVMVPKRGSGHSATSSISTQIITELDGVKANKNLLVIGSTNKPYLIDSAVWQRFHEKLYIPPPDTQGLKTMLGIYLGLDDSPRHEKFRVKMGKEFRGWLGFDEAAGIKEWKDIKESNALSEDGLMGYAGREIERIIKAAKIGARNRAMKARKAGKNIPVELTMDDFLLAVEGVTRVTEQTEDNYGTQNKDAWDNMIAQFKMKRGDRRGG